MKYSDLSYPDQKKAILTDLNNYVNHSFMVYNNSRKAKNNAEKLEETQRVKAFIYEINQGKDLFTICLKIFRLKTRLFKILPHPNNDSFESQFKAISDLTEFATSYVKPKFKSPLNQFTTNPAHA